MFSKERIKTTLKHKEPDRIPLFELSINNKVASDILGRETFVGGGISYRKLLLANMGTQEDLRESFQNLFQDTLELYDKAGLDMVCLRVQKGLFPVFPSLGNIGAYGNYKVKIKEIGNNRFRIEGEEDFWSECYYDEERTKGFYNTNDCIKEKGIKELERYVKYLENNNDNEVPYQIKIGIEEQEKAIKSKLGQKLFILGSADDLFPTYASFIEVFMEALITMPEIVCRYMDITTSGVLALLENQFDSGVDGIIGANDIASKNGLMISPKHYEKFILPGLKKIVERCHDKKKPFIKHYDGDINAILAILINSGKIDGLHSIEPVANMDIYEIKKRYGDRITIIGNLDCSVLMSFGTDDEIKNEIKRLIKNIAPGGGYIFSSSNAIHSGISTDRFNLIRKYVNDYGEYPLNIN